MDKNIEIIKNDFGFFEVRNKPTKEYLNNYYKNKYYQLDKGNYQKTYSNEEMNYINNGIKLKLHAIKNIVDLPQNFSLLDVGCGEGWVLNYFSQLSQNIIGIDFSISGIKNHNKHCEKFFIEGDIEEIIADFKKKNRTFDIIWLDNVLEHVLSPIDLLNNLYSLSHKNTILVIEVPNDFSILQNYAYENKFIDSQFWIVYPDHLSYFNKEGLINITNYCNWSKELLISDFPIDFNLLNNTSNYISDKTKGKDAHLQRILIHNLMFNTKNIDSIMQFYSSLANLGLGRQIIGFFKAK